MQPQGLRKQRWVEYSSDGTSSLHSSESSILPNPELEKLNKINPSNEFIWLQVKCTNASEATKNKIRQLRFLETGSAVYQSKTIDGFDIKVKIDKARQLLSNSYPGLSGLPITLGERNFANTKVHDKKGKNRCDSEKKPFRRHTGSRDNKIIHYVDKETGKAPNNRKTFNRKRIEEGQRKYSRKEALTLGGELGQFRSKDHKQAKQRVNTKPNKESMEEYMTQDSRNYEHKSPTYQSKQVRSEPKFIPQPRSSSKNHENPWRKKQPSKNNDNKPRKPRQSKGNLNSHKSPRQHDPSSQYGNWRKPVDKETKTIY